MVWKFSRECMFSSLVPTLLAVHPGWPHFDLTFPGVGKVASARFVALIKSNETLLCLEWSQESGMGIEGSIKGYVKANTVGDEPRRSFRPDALIVHCGSFCFHKGNHATAPLSRRLIYRSFFSKGAIELETIDVVDEEVHGAFVVGGWTNSLFHFPFLWKRPSIFWLNYWFASSYFLIAQIFTYPCAVSCLSYLSEETFS